MTATANFDTLAAAKEFTQAGFNARQTDALVGSMSTIQAGVATTKDINRCWQVILGVVAPLLLLNIGLSVSIALSISRLSP